jgi:hypothetical protein
MVRNKFTKRKGSFNNFPVEAVAEIEVQLSILSLVPWANKKSARENRVLNIHGKLIDFHCSVDLK